MDEKMFKQYQAFLNTIPQNDLAKSYQMLSEYREKNMMEMVTCLEEKAAVPAVKPKKPFSNYEELMCAGFNNCDKTLGAVINLKKCFGYGGQCPNGPGTFEYVRFFVNFNNDPDFADQFEDIGVAKAHVFDPCYTCCRQLPVSYGISLKVCLPKFKWDAIQCKCFTMLAILEWNKEPPLDPNYVPFWGSIIKRTIRIHPY